ncbi:MAG: hypothetical protein AMXMBFR7_17510 [Planctomycetota bacterium]
MQTPEWIARCIPAHEAVLDLGVLVWDSWYVGPENDFSKEKWKELRTPLYRPQVAHRDIRKQCKSLDSWMPDIQYISIATATPSDLEEVRRYCSDLLRIMAAHGQQIRTSNTQFHLRLAVFVSDDLSIDWPWDWTWNEIQNVLNALASPMPIIGIVYNELEQGWRVEIFASQTNLFMRESDYDTGEERRLIACNRESIVQQASRLKAGIPAKLVLLEEGLNQQGLFGCQATGSPHKP